VTREVLKNKPLAEAIFELRWNLQEPEPRIKIDPHYKILIGGMYDKLKDEYPFHEQLPTASIPDEVAGYVVQHRFRKSEGQWPLIQMGPGIITVNDTEGYIWEDFEKRIVQAVKVLFEVYPDSKKDLKIKDLVLRYIDAIDFDFKTDNIFKFLKKNMKTNISLYPKLFENTGVKNLPLGFDWKTAFRSSKPKGLVNLRFGSGKRKERDALLWETMVRSVSQDLPNKGKFPEKIQEWLTDAHNLTDDWFFKLIEGELLRRFK